MHKICVVGLGYIGLPAASLLATKGFDVLGVDVNPHVVDIINRGDIHISEPDLDVLVKSAVNSGRLRASIKPAEADIFILAVPTPFKDGHVPDVDFVEAATRSIASSLRPGNLVILESTSPVGTTEKVAAWLAEERPEVMSPAAGVLIAHCPERVLPGQILRELVENDRIVGGVNVAATRAAADFYRSFVSGHVLETDSRTAELAKLAENTFRDINIAYANELSLVCERLGVDVWQLIKLANHHPRVNILQPGPGVGGHCIAVDPWFIVDSAPEQARLIRTAREVNLGKTSHVIDAVKQEAARRGHPTVACLGLAYKADIDDLRESPAVEIAHALAEAKIGRIVAVEPFVDVLPKDLMAAGVELASLDEALASAEVVVGLVNHTTFTGIAAAQLAGKSVIDTRGMWRSRSPE
jgi:UDP-N-acetyl-D-mannosaminuronic acid dehydrogenase